MEVTMNDIIDIEFKRKVYDKMLLWKRTKAPDYALFIKGARRVGKTTLARKIAREEYKSYRNRFDRVMISKFIC